MKDTPRSVTIRPATPLDSVNMLRLISDMHSKEYGTDLYPPIDEAATITGLIDLMKRGFVAVAECAGRIVGCIVLQGGVFFWNPNAWHLTNIWFIVHPAYREGGTAKGLLQAAIGFSEKHQVPLHIEIRNTQLAEVKDRFMKMSGFKYIGGAFVYDRIT